MICLSLLPVGISAITTLHNRTINLPLKHKALTDSGIVNVTKTKKISFRKSQNPVVPTESILWRQKPHSIQKVAFMAMKPMKGIDLTAIRFLNAATIFQLNVAPVHPKKYQGFTVDAHPSTKDKLQSAQMTQYFMLGCLGSSPWPILKPSFRQQYCRCALKAYQTRYTTEELDQILSQSLAMSQEGSTLISFMMKPELDQCLSKANRRRQQISTGFISGLSRLTNRPRSQGSSR